MTSIILGIIAIAYFPWLLRYTWRASRKVVFRGMLIPSIQEMDGLGKRTGTRYCWFNVPGIGFQLAEIPITRYLTLKENPIPATVTVVSHLLAKPKIESVTWPDSKQAESADRSHMGIYLAVAYLLAGLGLMVLGAEWKDTLDGHIAMFGSAALLALSGFTTMLFRSFKPGAIKQSSTRILIFNIGKGKAGLLLLLAICLAATIATFGWPSILTLLIGFQTAFACGSVTALLLKR